MKLLGVARSLVTGMAIRATGTKPTRLRPLDFSPFAAALDARSDARCRELDELLADASVAGLGELLGSGALTAEDLALHLLARIRRSDDELGTMIELDPGALDAARASDARRRAGAMLGPLDGVPVTVKDNIETAPPTRTTGGAVVLADHVADGDAPVVAALRRAGAVVLGSNNLSELAGAVIKAPGVSAVGGPTRNPHGDARSPGGSSSGSAAAVAAELTVVSVGTETSGSLVAPSAFNGVVGMKPSRGLVDGRGVIPLLASNDSPGPIGRSVADVAALLVVLAEGDLEPPVLSADALGDVRVGVLRADILSARSPYEDTTDQAAILDRIVGGLQRAGATTVDVDLTPAAEAKAMEASFAKVVFGGLTWETVAYLEAAGTPIRSLEDLHRYLLAAPRARMPAGQFFVDLARFFDIDEATHRAATAEAVERASTVLAATFEASEVDVLASTSARHSPFYATAGYPAITVPVGLHADGGPAGATFIGRLGEDRALLERAHAFEQATNLRVRPAMARTPPDRP